jgi:hypothetical protein
MLYYTKNNSNTIFGEFIEKQNVNLNTAKVVVKRRLEIMQNREHFFVIDISNVREITYEARKFLQREGGSMQNILAMAFIATNPVSRMIANIIIKAPRNFEARIFTDKKEACDWIFAVQSKRIKQIPQSVEKAKILSLKSSLRSDEPVA